jgi:hypothetical protein
MKQTALEVTRKIQLPYMHEDARGAWDSDFTFSVYITIGMDTIAVYLANVRCIWTGQVGSKWQMANGMANGKGSGDSTLRPCLD